MSDEKKVAVVGTGFNAKQFALMVCDCGLTHLVVVATEKLRKGAVLGIAAKREVKDVQL
jgi:hypothetical protein